MNILYLFPKFFYEKKMSLGRTLYGLAVADHPDVDLRFWGEGWEGYDNTKSLSWNIERSDFTPDWIWAYKPERHIGVTECEIPKVVCYNEAWIHIPGKAMQEVEESGIDLVIHHHANDAPCFPDVPAIHIPHAAPLSMRCSTPLRERSVDCLASGVDSKEIYPIRHTLKRLVESGELPGEVRQHPGYRLQSREHCERQFADYTAHLQRSKVSLCCTSKYKYLLAKIIESLMTGAVVVTDAADDPVYREKIQPHVIEVEADWSPEKIRGTVLAALDEPQWLQSLSDSGREMTQREFSMKHYAEKFVEALKNHELCSSSVST